MTRKDYWPDTNKKFQNINIMVSAKETTGINRQDWFMHWFDSAFYHQLYGHRDEKEASGFVDRLLEELKPPQKSRMLDLGCGSGRHAKYLASKGFDVTGLDLAASSIRTARKSETNNLHFYRHDMRVPFGTKRFDHVFNFFTSFGYFKAQSENDRVVKNISASLKSGGYLLMDYMNAAYAEERLVEAEEKNIDGVVYNITRWADSKFIFKKISIENMQAGIPAEFTEQVAKFGYDDFMIMFNRNGLEIQKIYGDYRLNGYDSENSPRLILLAKKI